MVYKYLDSIVKRIWIIILVIILSAIASAYVFYFQITPLYKAEATLFVLNDGDTDSSSTALISYNDLLAAQLLVINYKEIIKSRTITSAVISKLNLKNITEEKLAKRIDVDLIPESSILKVSVLDKSPATAKLMADKLSEVFIAKARLLTKMRNISFVDTAKTLEKPAYPKRLLFTILVTFLCMIVTIGIIILREYFDDTIGTSDNIERETGIPVVGIIPEISLK